MHFLKSTDITESIVMTVIAKRWLARKLELDRALAIEIINELGRSMKKGSG